MTSLPRQIRIQAAVREYFDFLATTDDAHGAFEDREYRNTCIRHRITDDDMEIEMTRQTWANDPMGGTP